MEMSHKLCVAVKLIFSYIVCMGSNAPYVHSDLILNDLTDESQMCSGDTKCAGESDVYQSYVESHISDADAGVELLFYSDDTEFSNYSCQVVGEVPSWLNGILIRNGPGKFEMGNRKVGHFFDGFAKLHSFNFIQNKSQVLFSSRFLESQWYSNSVEAQDVYPTALFMDTEPPLSTPQKLMGILRSMDNTMINVFELAGQTVAAGDMWKKYSFDKYTLGNAQKVLPVLPPSLPLFYNLMEALSISHPIQEHGSKAMITIATIENPLPIYSSLINVVRMHTPEQTELIASIQVERGHLMHSFALTRKHAVLFADPVFVNIPKLLQKLTVYGADEWMPELGTTVYGVRLEDGHVTKLFLSPPARFHEHHVNAYEEGDSIFLQVVTQKSTDLFKSLELSHLRTEMKHSFGDIDNGNDWQFLQYEINLKHGTIATIAKPFSNPLSNALDMPTFNEEYRFKHHCYTYGTILVNNPQTNITDWVLGKANNCGGDDVFWSNDNHYPTEPIFVPNPNGVSEDDGVVVSVVMDSQLGRSYLLVLDARTMAEVAQVGTPARIPMTLHGHFFPHQ